MLVIGTNALGIGIGHLHTANPAGKLESTRSVHTMQIPQLIAHKKPLLYTGVLVNVIAEVSIHLYS